MGEYFGEDVAASYDQNEASDPAVVGPAVDLLGQLAGGGRALEFAIGTGRIAVPLAARGRLPPGQAAVPFRVDPDRLGFDTYDTATQEMWSHHY